MRAVWSTYTNRLVVTGQHRGGTPRRWLVNLWVELEDKSRARWQLHPSQPLLLTDLAPLVLTDLAPLVLDEINQYPNKKAAGWTAIAR